MTASFSQYLIQKSSSVREALTQLNILAEDAILFVVDKRGTLEGALTDGDIRRGLIKGLGLDSPIIDFVQLNPIFCRKGEFDFIEMQSWRDRNYKVIPVVDEKLRIVDIVNFRIQKSYLPLDAVIMAGGKGTRLLPLTKDVPKPLLKVGDKPIIEYNIDRLKAFGIRNITLTIGHLGQQLLDYFGDGKDRDLRIKYINETVPLGTIGSVALIEQFYNDYVLVMNSDILTNINYENLFKDLIDKGGDMIVATVPYEVRIPYGVIDTKGDQIVDLHEKPTYTYYSNAGIYIFKREFVDAIPKNASFNATDLMQQMYSSGKRVLHSPILDYWLDIGKPHDFEKAQKDIKHIRF